MVVEQDERERLLAFAEKEVRHIVVRAAADERDAAIGSLREAPLDGACRERIAHAVGAWNVVQVNDFVRREQGKRLDGQAFVQVKDGDARTLRQQDDPLLSSALILKRCLIRSAELDSSLP